MDNDEYRAIFLKYNGDIDKITEETGYQRGSVITRLWVLGLIPKQKFKNQKPSKGKYLTAFLCDDINL